MLLRRCITGVRLIAPVGWWALASCAPVQSPSIPCNSNQDCPSAQHCRDGLCRTGSSLAPDDSGLAQADAHGDDLRSTFDGPAVDRVATDLVVIDRATDDRGGLDSRVADREPSDASRPDASVLCAPGSPCDDGNPCTDDYCWPGGDCVRANNDARCDDDNPCTEPDVCGAGACRGTAANEGLACSDVDHCSGDTFYSGFSCRAGACADDDSDLGCCAGSKCGPVQYCAAASHSCTPLPECKTKLGSGYGYTDITGFNEGPNCTVVCMGCNNGACAIVGDYSKDSNGDNRCDDAHRCCHGTACGEYTENEMILISASCSYEGTGEQYCIAQGYDWESTAMWCICGVYGVARDHGVNCIDSCAFHRPADACLYSPVKCGRYLCQ